MRDLHTSSVKLPVKLPKKSLSVELAYESSVSPPRIRLGSARQGFGAVVSFFF